jgi:hypothetical protein
MAKPRPSDASGAIGRGPGSAMILDFDPQAAPDFRADSEVAGGLA